MKLIKSLFILIIALILFIVVMPFGLLYALTRKWNINYAYKLVMRLAVSIDQLGNVAFAGILNKTMVKNIKPFGHEDDTVSEVLARNQDKLTKCGRILSITLEKLDPNHLQKSLD